MDSVGWSRQNINIPQGATPEDQRKELEKLQFLVKTKVLTPQYPNPDELTGRVKVLTDMLTAPVQTSSVPETVIEASTVLHITIPEARTPTQEEREIKSIEWALQRKIPIVNRTSEELKVRLKFLQTCKLTREDFLKKHPGSTDQEIPLITGHGVGAKTIMIKSGFPSKK